MAIQNIDQLTFRISEATDKLEVAVTNVQESAGVVVDGSGEASQSAQLATQAAIVAEQSATRSSQSAEQAKLEANKSASQADIATTKASVASSQADIATQQANIAKQAALDASNASPSTIGMVEEAPKDNRMYGRVDGAWGLIPVGGSGGNGTGAVDTVNGIAPDSNGNVTVPIPQPVPQVRSDWNATSGVAQILNKPTLFSGNYNDLTNKPEIPVVTPQVNPDWNATSGKAQILNKPVLFDGRYESLTGKPVIPTGGGTSNITDNSQLANGAGYIKDAPNDNKWYARKGKQWVEIVAGTAFSGDYRDLTNKPPLNTDGTVGGSGFSGDYNDLVNKPPLITSNTQLFNGAGYIKDAIADNKQYVRKNNKWEVLVSNSEKGFATTKPFYDTGSGGLYQSHSRTEDPNKRFFFWSHPNPHIPYPLYHLGLLSPFLTWITDGELITPEYFRHLPSGRYSFGQASFPTGHILALQTGYIEVVHVTSQQAIPTLDTLESNGLATGWSTGVVYTIDDNNKIKNIYDFDTKTGEFIVRTGGGNTGVTPFSGRYADLSGKPTLFSGNYNDLTNKPTLFSGDYNDLINKPVISGNSFSGNYNDLTNKPTIPTVPTKLSQFTNDLTITATKVVNKRTGLAFEEWIGTQAQYDAIATKDPNTRYWITEA